jgi:predicted DNA binding protein
MRHLTVIVDPGDRRLVSVFDSLDPDRVRREYLHHYNLLTDGTVVMLYQFRGDFDHARAIFDASPDVVHYDIPEQEDGFVYLHCKMNESLGGILSAVQQSEIIMTMPIEFLDDERLRVTFIGEHKPLQQILAKSAEFVDIEIEQVSEYGSEDRLSSALTERQQEILKVAVEQGYYEVPRQATIRDIADAMELSQATVGEHLQKIESRVLSGSVY